MKRAKVAGVIKGTVIDLVCDESNDGLIQLRDSKFVTASDLTKEFGGYQEFTIPMKGKQVHDSETLLRDLMLCYVTVLEMKEGELVKAEDFPWSGGTQPANGGQDSELLIFLPPGYHLIFNRSEFFSTVQRIVAKVE